MPSIASYFNPFSNEHTDKRYTFFTLSGKEQLGIGLLTLVTTVVTLPFLGCGGLATFRALTENRTQPIDLNDPGLNPYILQMHTIALESLAPSNEVDEINRWAADPKNISPETAYKFKYKLFQFLKDKNASHLDLSNLKIKDLPDIFHWPEFKRLESLNLGNNDVDSVVPLSRIEGSALKKLDLKNTNVDHSTVSGIKLLEKKWDKLTIDLQKKQQNITEITKLQEVREEIPIITPKNKSDSFDIALSKSGYQDNPVFGIIDKWGELGHHESEDVSKIKMEILHFLIDPNATQLTFSGAYLSNFPDIFHLPEFQRLEYLDLSKNQLDGLPNIQDLRSLKHLNLSENKLRECPLGEHPSLEHLDLNKNDLTRFNISKLFALKYLNLSGNSLNCLDREIGKCKELQTLDLSECQELIGLPRTILDLPATCTIDLNNSTLAYSAQEKISKASSVSGYQGPIFQGTFQNTPHLVLKEDSIEGLLKEFSLALDIPYKPLIHTDQNENLKTWLFKLKDLINNEHSREIQDCIMDSTLSVLKLIDKVEVALLTDDQTRAVMFEKNINISMDNFVENEMRFRAIFEIILNKSDRMGPSDVLLSLVDLHMAYRDMDYSEIFVNPRDTISEIAANFKKTKWLTSCIKNFIGIEKERFEFFDLTRVISHLLLRNEEKLLAVYGDEDSRKVIPEIDSPWIPLRKIMNDDDNFHKFLIQDWEWLNALQQKYPQEFETALELNPLEKDEALLQLTKKAVASE